MYIHEAVKQAMERNGWIVRGCVKMFETVRIKPTNTGFNCIVKGRGMREAPCWNPSAEDLIAEDWEVVSDDDYEFLRDEFNCPVQPV